MVSNLQRSVFRKMQRSFSRAVVNYDLCSDASPRDLGLIYTMLHHAYAELYTVHHVACSVTRLT